MAVPGLLWAPGGPNVILGLVFALISGLVEIIVAGAVLVLLGLFTAAIGTMVRIQRVETEALAMIGRTVRWRGASLTLDGTLRTQTAVRRHFCLTLETNEDTLTIEGAPHLLLWLEKELLRVAATLPEERAQEHVPHQLRALRERGERS